MQILLIHSDYIEYETKRSTPVAEKVEEELKKGRMEEALTVFVAVEKNDEDNIELVAKQTAEEIKNGRCYIKTRKDAENAKDSNSNRNSRNSLRSCMEKYASTT